MKCLPGLVEAENDEHGVQLRSIFWRALCPLRFFMGGVHGNLRGFHFKGAGPKGFRQGDEVQCPAGPHLSLNV